MLEVLGIVLLDFVDEVVPRGRHHDDEEGVLEVFTYLLDGHDRGGGPASIRTTAHGGTIRELLGTQHFIVTQIVIPSVCF